MERKLDWRLEAIELLKQSGFESESNISQDLPHKLTIISVKDRQIRYCQRCGGGWPCLAAQEAAIDRGRLRRQR